MADLKRYSTTKATSLSSGMTSGDTVANLADGSTYPDPAIPGNGPYTVIIGYGSDREEICTVTGKPSTNSLTVTRAQDGSSAVAKNIGDIVVHGVSKRDWDDMLDVTTGGTLAGDLILAGDPTSDLMAATKQYVDDADALKAPLASPALTGNPTAPTPSQGDNDTSIATTAFVNAEIAADAPTKTGGGATGTWGIDISGNAATADYAATVADSQVELPTPPAEFYDATLRSITATSQTVVPGSSQVSFTNTTSRNVICILSVTGWMNLDDTVPGSGYVNCEVGGTYLWERRMSMGRLDASANYGDIHSFWIVAVAPGQMITNQIAAWIAGAGQTVTIQYTRTNIFPIGFTA